MSYNINLNPLFDHLKDEKTFKNECFKDPIFSRSFSQFEKLFENKTEINFSQVKNFSTYQEIRILAPGLQKEDFKVYLDNNNLYVSYDVSNQKGVFCLSEKYKCSWPLPLKALKDKISSWYSNGVLILQIQINAEKEIPNIQHIKVQ